MLELQYFCYYYIAALSLSSLPLSFTKDIAYPNTIDDLQKIDSVPVTVANLDASHGRTYNQPNSGEIGKVAVA
jgi:hypothetical protein